ncbi:MAG: prolipoprotein diacylglyceryl transferase [Bacteroidota bacterium]|jgi:prolipoprotein diacylglyceryl transferase|nr:prolipoprotein diacylglyceryl transferase [Bacteroidota bacterium]OQC46229.1 MAG: Prolipoprotein diacylglyceryl transferase [Bacteroidetes bacterium ADurb.Bin028]HNY43616.1 prolipoprotein diacylglyceryl transferase [Bacteroidales bacterium]HOD88121.1 prolipoprotein diacylglyceryl transferase [Bacteroidales bacterium]
MDFLFITWNVDPVIFYLGNRGIRWYGLLLAIGFLVGYLLLSRQMKKEGVQQLVVDKLAIYVIVGVVLGLRLGHCLFYNPGYYLSNPIEILYVWEGGLASHGGAAGILLAVWLFSRKFKINYLSLLDRVVLTVPFAGGMVRLGNLMNSEIIGVQTSMPWGFKFLRNTEDLIPAIKASGGKCGFEDLACLAEFWTPRHPTQLYEAIFYFIMFVAFYFIYQKYIQKWKPGVFLGWFITVLFVFRYFIEFTKVDPVEFDGWTDAIRMGQLLSIPFVLLGLFLMGRGYGWFKRKAKVKKE